MAKFTYNYIRNTNTDHTSFKLNYRYYSWISCIKNVDFYSKSKLTDKLLTKPRELIIIYKKNLDYAQKFQKYAYNKSIKRKNYAFGNKIWLNNKYIKIK